MCSDRVEDESLMLDSIFSWETLRWLMWLVYFPVCVFLMVIVLLQKGKGTSFAGAFGLGPGSDAVFGPRASKSLPVKLTYVSAGLFLVLALGLSVIEGKVGKGKAPERVDEEIIEQLPVSDELRELGLGEAYTEKTSEGPGARAETGAPGASQPDNEPASDSEAVSEAEAAPTEAPTASQPPLQEDLSNQSGRGSPLERDDDAAAP